VDIGKILQGCFVIFFSFHSRKPYNAWF
jgi:hypothetical protein